MHNSKRMFYSFISHRMFVSECALCSDHVALDGIWLHFGACIERQSPAHGLEGTITRGCGGVPGAQCIGQLGWSYWGLQSMSYCLLCVYIFT